ncbi:YacL family protein [Alteromonas gilva]|uniref:YacL family protein n=1 Tax=Alteromonas gilva TaxID=2987522 RepID=A0ABT5L1M5_9ALTE|nr:YacL family protein [Alteromonas gilva]MDC8829703.1 YacL family protein [Alteromonas gilva]
MDFEFITDVTGQPLAKCDIESEALGDWLSHDICTDKRAIESLLYMIEQLKNNQRPDVEFTGKIYHLAIADDEVELFLNNSQPHHDEFEDDYSDGPAAGCGLVEFTHLLESWRDFIN